MKNDDPWTFLLLYGLLLSGWTVWFQRSRQKTERQLSEEQNPEITAKLEQGRGVLAAKVEQQNVFRDLKSNIEKREASDVEREKFGKTLSAAERKLYGLDAGE